MRAFGCPRCGQLVYFENVECLRCRAGLGFNPETREIVRVADAAEASVLPTASRCANRFLAGCNWILPNPDSGELCRSCHLTRTRPGNAELAGDPQVLGRFVRAEAAKRRLVFQLLELRLPLVSRHEDPTLGLAFDFLVKQADPITIGHADGVITIDLAESDDAYRERMRVQLGEPYRTMLGHLRHEVGHYYWQVLVSERSGVVEGFRSRFGDERGDYQQALERHYDKGPTPGWADDHVSVYAAAHPWEDWAETWAHYLHIRDTLQTAASHGVIVAGPRFAHPPADVSVDPQQDPSLRARPTMDAQENFDEILGDWLPLTYALNAINRSMGKDDLYPFVLSPKVVEKLRFVHQRVLDDRPSAATTGPGDSGRQVVA
ncbi:MAG: hypothetical protein QOF30_2042 [Acidimicrobiaceae bacterium]|nr:hypothetical protein [Acidimicrobiaceae bacterium]